MAREFKYNGETFGLEPKECYVEVTYQGHKGFLGVNASGNHTLPHWGLTTDEACVSQEGITCGSYDNDLERQRQVLCDELLRIARARPVDREALCKELHEHVDRLGARGESS